MRFVLPAAVALLGLHVQPVAAQRDSAAPRINVDQELERVRLDPNALRLPARDSISVGARTVAAADTVIGTAAVVGGNLEIFGRVTGDAIAVRGDVIVHRGGSVGGSALSALGKVILDGGTVAGEIRTLQGAIGAAPKRKAEAPVTGSAATVRALKLALGWVTILAVIGIGVLIFAGSYLDGVVEAVERNFTRSLWTGVLAQVAALPLLLVLCIALALTIIGALLIPFAIVAYALAAAGVVTLGFLAVAQITGRSIGRRASLRPLSERGAALRGLITGVLVYTGLWVIAAAFTWAPLPGALLRGIAFAVCWVAATVGFGAAILSRAGVAHIEPAPAARPTAMDSLAWQTPTPVSGVVAARRPTPAPPAREIK
jgi:hypothetical protein